jgi:hypothetical protein
VASIFTAPSPYSCLEEMTTKLRFGTTSKGVVFSPYLVTLTTLGQLNFITVVLST